MKSLLKLLLLIVLVASLTAMSRHASIRVERERHRSEFVRSRVVHLASGRDDAGSTERFKRPTSRPDDLHKVSGQVSATEERAKDDARRILDERVVAWLEPHVPRDWSPPRHLIDAMVVETRVSPTEKPYGTVYTAVIDADFNESHRRRLVDAFRGELVRERTLKLGAAFGFLLVCLAATSGYIRADEATKGYYTNRLRMVAAAAVGASGVLIYQFLS